jgi:hypothetical protein
MTDRDTLIDHVRKALKRTDERDEQVIDAVLALAAKRTYDDNYGVVLDAHGSMDYYGSYAEAEAHATGESIVRVVTYTVRSRNTRKSAH